MMPRLEELLVAYERYCARLAQEEFDRSIEKSKDKESARIECRELIKEYVDRCAELAGSDYVRAKYMPTPEALAKSKARGAQPTREELAQAEIDTAIIEFYRKMLGLDRINGSSREQTYPDWQTTLIERFVTKQTYLKAVKPIVNACRMSIGATSAVDTFVGICLKTLEAYENARQRMYDVASLVGRYKISSELWEKQAGEYQFRRAVELNLTLADPDRATGFVYIDREGNLVHSYRFASVIKTSRGETITSQAGDLNPVLLVPHTCTKHLIEPSLVAVIYFGKDLQEKLRVLFQTKSVG
jgi:hypothetical protein